MKKISAYKKKAVLLMIVVMSFHVVGGLRLFCANQVLPPVRAVSGENGSLAVTPTDRGSAEVFVGASIGLDKKGGSSQCGCKKKPKCAAIPRAAITSNPPHRFSEFQRQAKSICSDVIVPQMTTGCFAARGTPLFMELGSRAPSSSRNPLSLTCILLI
jgi:hypothetical protein